MQRKLLLGAAAVALLICGYAGLKAYAKKKTAALKPNYTPKEYISLANLDRNKPGSLEFPNSGLRLEYTEDSWSAQPALPGPLQQAEVHALFRSLAGLQAERVIDENPGDLRIYGLDNPAGRALLQTAEGASAEFLAGNLNPSQTGYYVLRAGDPKVYLVPAYYAAGIFATAFKVRERALTSSFSLEDVKEFRLESDKTRIRIQAKPEDQDLPFLPPFCTHVMTEPYTGVFGVNSEAFEKILAEFQNLGILEFLDSTDKNRYGLDRPLQVSIETINQKTDLLLGKRENQKVYAQRRGEPEIFAIPDLPSLSEATAFALVDKFARIVNIDRVDFLSIAGPLGTLTGEIRRDEEKTAYFLNSQETEEKKFKNWYQKVIGILADAEIPRETQAPGPPETILTYQLNNPPETSGTLYLIPYNRDFYALSAEGQAPEFLISKNQIKNIYSAPEE
ncbi:MAG: DUF4340 domain-containing protein [Spirochaetaceae bacterium]|jgi:hypothetical protein|nr:DUF4340 domain-containing protein [Spirochaetaceae bacterium]